MNPAHASKILGSMIVLWFAVAAQSFDGWVCATVMLAAIWLEPGREGGGQGTHRN